MKFTRQTRLAVLVLTALNASASSAVPLVPNLLHSSTEASTEWLVLAGLAMMVYMRLRQANKDRR